MERTTCYKLCYALGVSDTDLSTDYPVEHRVASNSTAFMPGTALEEYRTLASLYLCVMADYPAYVDPKKFQEALKGRFLVGNLDISTTRGDLAMLNFMQRIVTRHNELCRKAYQELETAIPYDLFCMITLLPELSAKVIAQLVFIMSHTSRAYGLHFFGKELLNISLGSMLQDDVSLRDRLCLCSDQQVDPLYDRSEMPMRVGRYLSDVFLSMEELYHRDGLVTVATDTARTVEVAGLCKTLASKGIVVESYRTVEEVPSGSLCISGGDRWVAAHARENLAIDFAVLLPIESRFYKQWRRRTTHNIYIISRR